jgi:hypothetical protein
MSRVNPTSICISRRALLDLGPYLSYLVALHVHVDDLSALAAVDVGVR